MPLSELWGMYAGLPRGFHGLHSTAAAPQPAVGRCRWHRIVTRPPHRSLGKPSSVSVWPPKPTDCNPWAANRDTTENYRVCYLAEPLAQHLGHFSTISHHVL